MAKISSYQNFPGIQSMIFSKRTIRTTSIPKIRNIHGGVWKLKAKNLQNCQFWPKNGQILVLNGQNFAISEFSQHIEYDFLKEDHQNNFHTKNQEDSQRRLEVKAIGGVKGQKYMLSLYERAIPQLFNAFYGM